MLVIHVQVDSHVECEHKFMLLKETSAHILKEELREVLLELSHSSLDVLHLFINGEASDEQVSEPLHAELVHRVKAAQLLDHKV